MLAIFITTILGWVLAGLLYQYVIVPRNKRATKKVQPIDPSSPITAKRLLTEREKAMFRLLTRIPNTHVFVQVSLGAILHTETWAMRNKFNKKIADFVLTDGDFNVIAVIELDDRSHDDKKEQDAFRDRMVREAGYRVLRYPNIPKLQQVKNDLQ